MSLLTERNWWRLLLMQTLVIIVMILLRPLLTLKVGLRVRRARGLPRGSAYVLACNHRSFADPPLAGILQYDLIAYFARSSLWQSAFPRFLLTVVYGIPVDRDNPTLSSIRGAVEHLRAGIPVLVFPEGTRTSTGRLAKLREGPVLFARRAKVPIVPMYLFRSDRLMPRGSIQPRLSFRGLEVRIGKPIEPLPGLDEKTQNRFMLRRLERWMQKQERELLGPENVTNHSGR